MNFIIHSWPFIANHAYLLLFLGMLIGGETFLLPAVYLATKGAMSFPLLFLFAAAATVISDTCWYLIGRNFLLEKILSWKLFSKNRDVTDRIFSGFQRHSQKVLFISKFVYGTRTAAQVLSGSIRMPFIKYSVVNLAGIMSYLVLICVMAIFTKDGLANFGNISYNEYASIAIFIFIVITVHILLKKWLGKKILASSSQLGTKEKQ
jgi:membrane protein DedA with SNARE-associated domain